MGKRRKNVTIVLFLTKVNVFATDFLVFHRVLISRFPQLINCTNCCMDSFIAKCSLLFKATLVMAQSIPRVPIPPGICHFLLENLQIPQVTPRWGRAFVQKPQGGA